jgi:hypothetical protein
MVIPPLGSPEGPYIVGGPTAGHFVYPSRTSSSRFPNKGTLPEAPTMEYPKGRKQSHFVQPSKSREASLSPGSPTGASIRRDAHL